MAFLASAPAATHGVARPVPPVLLRVLLLATIVGAAAAGVLASRAGSAAAIAEAGDDLTHLLQLMAALKAAMAAGVAGLVFWRLGEPIGPVRFMAYAGACAAMAAGPALIWAMTHVGTGALVLHAGLLACLVLLWRDPGVGARLSALVTARRNVAP